MSLRLCQVILPVPDIEQAREFYGQLLETEGRRISPGRHSFDCGGTTVTCFDAGAEGGEAHPPGAGLQTILYLAVEDLGGTLERIKTARGVLVDQKIITQPWGTRSFRAKDPFGNPLGFVDEASLKRQLLEQLQGGPEDRLRVGMPLMLQRTQLKTGRPASASIAKIFPEEIWLALASAEQQPFAEREGVQIQFIEEGILYYADTQVLKVAPGAKRLGAIAIPQTIKMLQRRAAPRVSVELPLEVGIAGAADDKIKAGSVFKTTTRDISTGGVRFDTEVPLQEGDQLKLNMTLSGSHQLRVDARTVSANKIEGDGQDQYSVGVQFLGLKLDDQVKILQLLMSHQSEASPKTPPQEQAPVPSARPQPAPPQPVAQPAAAKDPAPAPRQPAPAPVQPQTPPEQPKAPAPEPPPEKAAPPEEQTEEPAAEDDIPLF